MAEQRTRIDTEPTEVRQHTEKRTDSVSSLRSVRSVLRASPGHRNILPSNLFVYTNTAATTEQH